MTFFFFYSVLFLRTGLRTVLTPLVIHHWPEKSADHGSRRLLPIASPMSRQRPNHTYRPHPHIMVNMRMLGFGILHAGVEKYGIIDTG